MSVERARYEKSSTRTEFAETARQPAIVVGGFAELQRQFGIAKNVLTVSLQKLVDEGIVEEVSDGWTTPID